MYETYITLIKLRVAYFLVYKIYIISIIILYNSKAITFYTKLNVKNFYKYKL